MTKRSSEPGSAEQKIVSLGILGPIEGWDSRGRQVRITPGQARVLAVLLESANEVVSAETIRDKLWPGDDPEGSTALLHTNVWSLRKLFAAEDGGSASPSIHRRGGGYQLQIDELQLDWFRFQRLVAAASQAIGEKHFPRAKLLLVDARRLWRGEALLGLTEGFTEPFVSNIEAVRAQANLQLIDVGLALGEHQELIPSLRHLTGRYPLDESLASRLMIALFRSGRQADALQVYDHCRRKLADAGLVPNPQLTDTEIDILTRSPAARIPKAPGPDASPWSSMSGTLLVGKWPAFSPPPWALGDGELLLAAESEGGELIQSDGTSLVARFGEVDTALSTAVMIQRHLKARGRGLGRFLVHDGSRAVSRGARLLDLCQHLLADAEAGQVLVIRSAENGDARRTPEGVELRELGEHHVRGDNPAVRVFQLVGPGVCEATPEFTLAPAPSHNLPTFPNRFVGRETLVEQIALALSRRRLVTLTGPGGGGKTRLAVEAARCLAAEYRDGTWLVELEWITDADLVPGAVADAVGIDRSRSLPVAEVVLRELAERHVLLVLDTCEHQLATVRPFVDRMLAQCPGISVLATSLQPLGCDLEDAIQVPPLEVPSCPPESFGDGPNSHPADELRASPAVRLFLECLAATAVSDIDLTRIARICALVDGIPLTIALAAARAQQLGLPNLVAELERAFSHGGALRLLDAGGKLGHTLEWSFSLLADEDRRTLTHLSLFAGPFTLDEAKDFCADSGDGDVAAALCRLVDCSAILVEGAETGTPRYRLPQPVRDFATIKLENESAEQSHLRRRHAELYLRVAQAADREFGGPNEHNHLLRLDDCIGNLRAALSWAITAREADLALGLAASLWRYWFSRGHLAEGRPALLAALELESDPTPAGIRVLGGSSYLSWWLGDLQYTHTSAEEQAKQAEAIDDAWGRAWAPLGLMAVAMFLPTVPPPASDLRASITWFIDAGLPWEAGQALQLVAGANWHRGDYAAAELGFSHALELNRAAGNQTFMDALQAHGLMLALQGRVADGVQEIQLGLELADRRRDPVGICHAFAYRAAIARYEGDFDESARLYTLSLRAAYDTGEAWIVLWSLDGLAAWAASVRAEVAARLLGHAETMSESTGIRLAPRERDDHALAVRRVQTKLGKPISERAFSLGRALSTAEAVKLALGLGT